MTGLNPLNWYGTEFLILYALLFVAACAASWWTERRLRPVGREEVLGDADALAVLGAGRVRLAEATIARMLERGALTIADKQLHVAEGATAQTATEQAIVDLPSPLRWGAVDRAMANQADAIERDLIRRRLLLAKGDALGLGFNAATPFLMLICFGLAKLLLGVDRDLPVGFLTMFLLVTCVVALVRWFGMGRHTKAGKEALKQARADAARLRIAPTGSEMGMAVALFGTGVIATSPIGDFHRMREQASGGSGDSGSGGDGDGGGGGGGGGCGGCGG